MPNRGWLPRTLAGLVPSILCLACVTDWQSMGTYPQSVETELRISSDLPAAVYLNHSYRGETPIAIHFRYEQMVERWERKTSYWRTSPGLSVLITLMSLGLYLPFSLLPIDHQQTLKRLDEFPGAAVEVELRHGDGESWSRSLELAGEKVIDLHASFGSVGP